MSTPKIAPKIATLTPEAIKNRQDFILWVTDYLHGHWEDPNWGRRQVIYQNFVKAAAEKMDNVEVRKAIQTIIAKETR